MDMVGESPRGLHAIRVLENKKDFTLDRLRDAAYDSYLTAFDRLVPALLAAYDSTPANDSLKRALAEPIAALKGWDYRWASNSVPTSLAVYWGDTLMALTRGEVDEAGLAVYDHMATGTTAARKLEALAAAVGRLTRDFGTWKTPWGEINRFQRAHRRHRAAVQRPAPQQPGAVHLGTVGLTRVVRRQDLSGNAGVSTAPTATASSRSSSSGRTACGRRP